MVGEALFAAVSLGLPPRRSYVRLNDNLSKQCQSLFAAWFLDGPLDEYTFGKLSDILSLVKDPTCPGEHPELPYLPIDAIPMHSLSLSGLRPNSEAQSSLILFKRDDILIGAMRVYFHRVVLSPVDGITRSTCFVLRVKSPEHLSFATLLCNQDSTISFAQSTSKGSTMPYAVWDGGLAEMKVVIPSKKKANEFNELVLPLLRKIQSTFFENQRLIELRDTLLPKLLSGERS